MKANWQTKKLGDVCEVFEDGDWIEKKDQSSDGIRLIQTGNIGNGIFKDRIGKARYISEKTFKRLRCTEILPGDCLVSRLPDPVGRSCIMPYTEDKMITAVDCTIIRFQKKVILPEWFVNFSLSQKYQDQIDKEVGGSTRQRISRKNLGQIEIPLPPLPEQRRIVKISDEVFAEIAKAKENAEKNLQNAKELFESYLQRVFLNPCKDCVEKTLEDVCEIQSKLIDPRKSEFLDLVHIGAGNIEAKSGKLINLKTSREEKLISGKFLFDNLMVLYSKIRPYLMKVVRPGFNGLCSADIYPLFPIHDRITRDYLFYLLLTQNFTEYAIKGSGRAGMPKVNREHLFAFNFLLPPIKEQKSIVARLDALSVETKKLEVIYSQRLADLEELKKSVLKKAFGGKL